MNKTPIKIDLSIFFNDERRKVLLIFNTEWKTVECLQKRVESLFDLESVRFLSDDGCFIPPQESIEVIKFCSGLKAFIHNERLQKKKNKKERKKKASISDSESGRIIEKGCINDVESEVDQKKRKYRSLESGFTSSTPNKAKRIKNDVRLNATLVCHPQLANKSSEISSTSEQMPPPLQPTFASSDSTSMLIKGTPCVSMSTAVKGCDVEDAVPTHRSLSKKDLLNESGLHQSRCTVAEAMSINDDNEVTTPAALPMSLPSSTLINENKPKKKKKRSTNPINPFSNTIANTKHIFYGESGEISTTTGASTSSDKNEVEVETKVIFHCSLNDRDAKKPRIFQIQPQKLGPKICDKTDIEIQENIVLSPLDVQTILNKSQIFDIPPQDEIQTKENSTKSLVPSADDSEHDIERTDGEKQDGQSSADEGNCSLNDSNNTASTAIDKYKETSMDVSLNLPDNQTNGNESSNIPTNPLNGDGISMNQTANSEENETSIIKDVNESSIVSVDCVDLSIDLDDDDDKKHFKGPQDVSNYDSSDVEEVSEVIDLNESEEYSNSSKSFECMSKRNIKLCNIMAFCTKLTQLPEIGDVLVFKVPYVSRNGSKCITEFLAGEALYINKRTKSIKIIILDGLSELCYVPAKFLNNLDDSTAGEKFVQMKPSDMIEPKILRKK